MISLQMKNFLKIITTKYIHNFLKIILNAKPKKIYHNIYEASSLKPLDLKGDKMENRKHGLYPAVDFKRLINR